MLCTFYIYLSITFVKNILKGLGIETCSMLTVNDCSWSYIVHTAYHRITNSPPIHCIDRLQFLFITDPSYKELHSSGGWCQLWVWRTLYITYLNYYFCCLHNLCIYYFFSLINVLGISCLLWVESSLCWMSLTKPCSPNPYDILRYFPAVWVWILIHGFSLRMFWEQILKELAEWNAEKRESAFCSTPWLSNWLLYHLGLTLSCKFSKLL